MSVEYWNQWSGSDLMSMHGIEVIYDYTEEETNEDNTCDDVDQHESGCPYCTGRGCNWCLMLSW